MAQKKDKCLTCCFVQAFVQPNAANKLSVTLFHGQIQEIFSLLHRPELVQENDVVQALLICPLPDIGYDSKSKIISEVNLRPE